jgi:hypothetical protein
MACTLLADAPLLPFIPFQGVLMVLMNLGVVALPIIEIGRFFVDPVHDLLQRCGVLRGDVSTALVGEPTDAPADAEVDGVKGQILRALVSALLAEQLDGLQVAGGGKTGADGVEHGVGWALEGQTDR